MNDLSKREGLLHGVNLRKSSHFRTEELSKKNQVSEVEEVTQGRVFT